MLKSCPLFIAITKEKKNIIGTEDYMNPGWKELPERLDKVFFRLPDKNYIVMQNYEKYLYIVEGAFDANGKNRGKLRIEYIYFMGLRNNIVESYRIKMFSKTNDRYKVGDITQRQYKWNDIKNKYTGWK